MKGILPIMVFSGVLVLGGCSGESGTKEAASTEVAQQAKDKITQDKIDLLLTDPAKYKGAPVDVYAKVFTQPERDDKGTYLQVFAKQDDGNMIVAINNPKLDIKQDDIIHIVGEVKGKFEGENAMGGKITAPQIVATTIEKSDYVTAFSPSLKTIEVNQEKEQHGYKLTISKVELAKDETRVYVTATNTSSVKAHFYSHNTKLIVGGQQMEPTDSYGRGYPEIPGDILPGITSQGVITYPAITAPSGQLQIYIEANTENYSLDFAPYTFGINY